MKIESTSNLLQVTVTGIDTYLAGDDEVADFVLRQYPGWALFGIDWVDWETGHANVLLEKQNK